MPLIKRLVEPVHISRSVVPSHINNELEFVGNGTLANVMRQLGALSAHADDLFAELHRDAASLLYRVGQLTERVERVQSRIVKLNPIVEEVSLQDINMRKPFRSSIIKEQQVITQSTRPQSVMLIYQHCCEPPPALHILNPYREDGRNSMTFYTDPGYFLELWCLEIAKDTENQMRRHRQRGRRAARPSKQALSIRAPKSQRANYAELRHGPEFVENVRRHDHPISRQSTLSEAHSPKVDLRRTGSLQQQPMEARNWNVNAGMDREHLAYQPNGTHSRQHGYSRDSTAAVHPAEELSRSLQPTAAALTSHSDTKHQLASNKLANASLHQVGYSTSVSNSSYVGSSVPSVTAGNIVAAGLPSSTAHQVAVAEHQKVLRDGFDLPAPPTPLGSAVVRSSSLSGDPLPSPPHMMMLLPDTDLHLSALPLPQYLPPPELVVNSVSTDSNVGDQQTSWHSSDMAPVTGDAGSDTSSLVTAAQQADDGILVDAAPMVRDTRSDLLAAIREGIQLRKVEERRQKSAQKQQQAPSSASRLDVQAIMEAAFEMRRKALEENDSEEDDDADGRWSDND